MEEIAEGRFEGIFCHICGIFLYQQPPGHPCLCDGCKAKEMEPGETELDFEADRL